MNADTAAARQLDEIDLRFGVHQAALQSRVARATEAVAEEIRALRDALAVGAPEFRAPANVYAAKK